MTDVEVITVDDTHELAAGAEPLASDETAAEAKHEVIKLVLVESGRVVTDSEKEVETVLETIVENCVDVGVLEHTDMPAKGTRARRHDAGQ